MQQGLGSRSLVGQVEVEIGINWLKIGGVVGKKSFWSIPETNGVRCLLAL